MTDDSRPGAWLRKLGQGDRSWLMGALIALVVCFSVINPQAFLGPVNLRSIAIDVSIFLIIGVGQTYVIMTRGIDLSVGSVLVVSGMVSVLTTDAMGGRGAGWPATLCGVAVALLTGLAFGMANGLAITRLRVPPLIVTLGIMGIALGTAQVLGNGQDLSTVPRSLTDSVGFGRVLGIPVGVLIAAAVVVAGAIVLYFHCAGRYAAAIGSNPEAARRAGINVDRWLIAVYAAQGLLAGLAAVLSMARFTTTTIGGHGNDSLLVIAGVVLGGTSLAGGVGTIFGTVLGILIPAVLRSGLVIAGVQPFWQTIVTGAVLIVAVYVDQLRRQRRSQA